MVQATQVVYLDPAERAREKQASRDDDARSLASGKTTAQELNRVNGFIPVELIATSRFNPRDLLR